MHIVFRMKKDIEKIIEFEEGIGVIQNGDEIVIKGKIGENKRKFNFRDIEVKIESHSISLKKDKANKNDKKQLNAIAAHIKNMIAGVSKKYEYVLEICSVHFPMTLKIEKDKLNIKNFLGERKERTVKILPEVNVEIKGSNVIITSIDKEKAGRQATLIEGISRVVGKDKRVFQDGIWIVKKEKGK